MTTAQHSRLVAISAAKLKIVIMKHPLGIRGLTAVK